MSDIEVTIIMITWSFNDVRFRLLQSTMESLIRHTRIPCHLTVIDNGPERQTEYLKTLPIDTHIINPVNLGPGKSRNQGAELATTKYLAFCDNDLLFYDGWLERSLNILKDNLDMFPFAVVTGGYSMPMKNIKYQIGTVNNLGFYDMAASWCWIMPKSTFEYVGPFRTNDTHAVEDHEWSLRAKSMDGVFLCPPPPRVKHIVRCNKPWTKNHRLINGRWVR